MSRGKTATKVPPKPTSHTSCHDHSGPIDATTCRRSSGRCGDKPVQHASAEIAPVQDHVDDEHEADNAVPCRDHSAISSPGLATTSSPGLATTSSSGP